MRNTIRIRLQIWQIMLLGALAVLITGEISPVSALFAINYDVLIFLFGVFVAGEALFQSGALIPLMERVFKGIKSRGNFFLVLIFGSGFLSAFLMNDTVAIIGTVFVLLLAKKTDIPSEMLLLALAFSVTTGSVLSPVGNPQNLLIASGAGLENPFLIFAEYLLIPTIISLFLIYPALNFFYPYRPEDKTSFVFDESEKFSADVCVLDKNLSKISALSIIILFVMIFLKIIAGFFGYSEYFPLTLIAVFTALPVIVLSKKRLFILKNIDWQTLVFFSAMFVLMQSVWSAGFIQGIFTGSENLLLSNGGIFISGVLLSQILSNVPFVALFMPLLLIMESPESSYMALAAGSTLAGNLLLFGAASNIIIVQNAEKRGEKLSFLRFARVGIPLTIAQSAVYIIWLVYIMP